MIYVLQATPVAKASARHDRYKIYDNQKNMRSHQRIELERQHDDRFMFKNIPLKLTVTFYLPIPGSLSEHKKQELEGTLHMQKPHLSNMLKWVENLAANLIYHEDCLIAQTVMEKRWSNNPRTEFTIVPTYE